MPLGAPTHTMEGPSHHFDHSWYTPPQSDPKLVFFGVLFLRCLPAVFFDALGAQFGPPNLSQMVSKMKPTSKHETSEFDVIYYTFALFSAFEERICWCFLLFLGDVKMGKNM